jgi:hypothetical protein
MKFLKFFLINHVKQMFTVACLPVIENPKSGSGERLHEIQCQVMPIMPINRK